VDEARQLRRFLPAGALFGLLLIAALSPVAASAQAPLPKANGKLAFVSFRDGNPEIYTTNPDGTQQVRLTTNPGSSDLPSDFWPSWSPDGAKIVYTSDRGGGGNLDVWTMNPDGTGQSRITTDPAGDLDPALSPDGTKVVFVRGLFSPSGPPVFDIYSVNLGGTGETRGDGPEAGPSWWCGPPGTRDRPGQASRSRIRSVARLPEARSSLFRLGVQHTYGRLPRRISVAYCAALDVKRGSTHARLDLHVAPAPILI